MIICPLLLGAVNSRGIMFHSATNIEYWLCARSCASCGERKMKGPLSLEHSQVVGTDPSTRDLFHPKGCPWMPTSVLCDRSPRKAMAITLEGQHVGGSTMLGLEGVWGPPETEGGRPGGELQASVKQRGERPQALWCRSEFRGTQDGVGEGR